VNFIGADIDAQYLEEAAERMEAAMRTEVVRPGAAGYDHSLPERGAARMKKVMVSSAKPARLRARTASGA
jgi:hypothetical protein